MHSIGVEVSNRKVSHGVNFQITDRGLRNIAESSAHSAKRQTTVSRNFKQVHQFNCIFYGPVNGECFIEYVPQFLVPCLKHGDIVVIDDIGSQNAEATRLAIKKAGATLFFVPP
jgi:diaminopimelate decarboxylase